MAKFEKLVKLRIERGLTQDDMAKKLGISKPFYCQVENRQRRLSYKTAYLIGQILDTKPDEIFYDEVKEFNGKDNLK